MPLLTVFQSYQGDSSYYSCLSWVSPVLGWGSEVSCPRTLPRKNPEDPVWLEPRTPGLCIKHITSEPCRTPYYIEKGFEIVIQQQQRVIDDVQIIGITTNVQLTWCESLFLTRYNAKTVESTAVKTLNKQIQ